MCCTPCSVLIKEKGEVWVSEVPSMATNVVPGSVKKSINAV